MREEKIFVVLSHKYVKAKPPEKHWNAIENVSFVNKLTEKHLTMSTIIGDYINRDIIIGSSKADYITFEAYVNEKFPEEMKKLHENYGALVKYKKIPVE